MRNVSEKGCTKEELISLNRSLSSCFDVTTVVTEI